jgi:hypothetical protein
MVLVTSWNGRDGDVVPLAGDYTAAMVNYTAAGTGAVTRAVQAKVGELVFSVKDYGAIGSGVDNPATIAADTNAINAAISAMGAAGGILYFPPGTYSVGGTITIPDNNNGVSGIWIMGSGTFSTTIKAKNGFPAGSDLLRIVGETTITDISISGYDSSARASQDVYGLRNATTTSGNINSIVQRVNFSHFGGTSAAFINSGSTATYHILDCFFNTNNLGINNYDWGTGSVIARNHFGSNGGMCLRIDNHNYSAEGIIVDSNEMTGTTAANTNAVEITGGVDCYFINDVIDAAQGVSVYIAGVNPRGMRFVSCWLGEGLKAYYRGINNLTHLTISDCTFPRGVITLDCQSGNVANFLIAHNQFYGQTAPGSYSILLFATGRGLVTGNVFADVGGCVYENGGTAGTILVDGNIFSSPSAYTNAVQYGTNLTTS